MFLVAVGIALSIISNLGTSPLSCPAYVCSLRFPRISVGTFTWMVNCVYILVQLAILGRRFKPRYLLQIVASVMLGYMIDGSLLLFRGWLHPQTIAARLAIVCASCCVSALGVSMELASRAWMLSAEMTVNVISSRWGLEFRKVKVVMDSTMVVLAGAFAWVNFGNPFGGGRFTGLADMLLARMDGVVIASGTIILAFGVGFIMKLTDPIAQKWTEIPGWKH